MGSYKSAGFSISTGNKKKKNRLIKGGLVVQSAGRQIQDVSGDR